jgi:ABC-2 type transport system ATP-binding protein
VLETVELWRSFTARPRPAAEAIGLVGLTDKAAVAVAQLSGGEGRRLELALAVLGRPELLFLDEPTAGMDTHARHDTWRLIDEVRSDGVSVLLTTHLLDEAERLADDVVIIDAGRVAAAGSPAALTAAAGVEQLHIHADPGLPVRELADRLPELVCATEPEPGVYAFAGTLAPGTVAAICGWYADRKAHLSDLYTRRRTLEDVFLTLVDRSR